MNVIPLEVHNATQDILKEIKRLLNGLSYKGSEDQIKSKIQTRFPDFRLKVRCFANFCDIDMLCPNLGWFYLKGVNGLSGYLASWDPENKPCESLKKQLPKGH